MSWLNKLSETYDNCSSKIGDSTKGYPLVPICHTTQAAMTEIIIDGNGEFLGANVVSKDDSLTITPCTINSAGRAGAKISSHPLFDEFKYVAGDFIKFGGVLSKSFKGKETELHEDYVKLLSDWCNSDYEHPDVCSVLKYIRKKSVISDLVERDIIKLNKDRIMLNDNATNSLLKGNIRFSVEYPGHPQSHLWENKKIWKSWIDYYLNKINKNKRLCYVTGEESIFAEQHPKKILPGEANAKLISANDTNGFTYRGRFLDDIQACNVSYEISQKAHNALTWLIRRQGSSHGSQSVVAWAVKNCDVPRVTDDTLSLIFGENEKNNNSNSFDAGQNLGKAFSKMIAGYSAKLGNTDEVIVMALDSLTSGRAAIKYYRQLTGSEYLERVKNWHTNCSWRQRFSKDKKFIGAPAPKDIAKSAYGGKVDNKLLKATIERLLPCIVDMAPLPRDIIECCINNIKRRNSFDFWEWEKNLGITCALYKLKYIERNYTMALEKDRNSRDYLYGRLLALAESIERMALLSSGENRPTNAERLMQRFAEKPYSTWRTIELALNSCKQRLRANLPGFLNNREKDVIEVKDKFVTNDFCNDSKLSGEFLLGYDCQRSELPPWKDKNNDNNNVNVNE